MNWCISIKLSMNAGVMIPARMVSHISISLCISRVLLLGVQSRKLIRHLTLKVAKNVYDCIQYIEDKTKRKTNFQEIGPLIRFKHVS